MSLWPDIDAQVLLMDLALLASAFALALPIGWDREASRSSNAGLRNLSPGVGRQLHVLLLARGFTDSPDALARVFWGVITGVGFLGGGAIPVLPAAEFEGAERRVIRRPLREPELCGALLGRPGDAARHEKRRG